jgi:DNA-binding NarL/FixJ family response regulator
VAHTGEDVESPRRAPLHEPGDAEHSALRFPPARRQVLALLLQGYAEKQVAVRLGLKDHIVHRHVKKIYKSYGVQSRAELCGLFVNVPTIQLERASVWALSS